VVDEDEPAGETVQLLDLPACFAERRDRLVDAVRRDLVACDTCQHVRNRNEPRGVATAVVDRPLDEEELVEQARRGDLRAWETIVRTHQGIAFRTAYVLTRSAADAEEAAQDGFVKAYRALGRFRRGAPLRPWLLKIVANEARNRRRAAARREVLALRAAAEDRPGDAVPSPEAALLAGESRGQLLAAINRLSDDHRDAIACRYFLELSEEETAAALGVRRGTVKSRLARALERLREELGEGAE
jgi:RNA polymerase sigma-70 factor, ECF subfamily